MKQPTIFYSWQSDDSKTNSYIQASLEETIDAITTDPMLEARPRLDQDTKHVPGAPDIPSTIITKIENCDIFIADISFVGQYKNRMLVNQNVLFELGYNMGRHSADNTILLFNADRGRVTDLPFDLRTKRVIKFSINSDPDGKKLTKELQKALQLQFSHPVQTNGAQPTTPVPKDGLDEDESLIMEYFANMQDEKRIMVSRTMSGVYLAPVGKVETEIANKLTRQMSESEIVANLESLKEKGLLKVFYGNKGTPNYEPTKAGFKLMKSLIK